MSPLKLFLPLEGSTSPPNTCFLERAHITNVILQITKLHYKCESILQTTPLYGSQLYPDHKNMPMHFMWKNATLLVSVASRVQISDGYNCGETESWNLSQDQRILPITTIPLQTHCYSNDPNLPISRELQINYAFSALTLFVGWQEGHPECKKLSGGVVICLERGTDLHTAKLMPLPFTVSCFS